MNKLRIDMPLRGEYPSRKEFMAAYQREWMRRRRAEFFADKSCDKCSARHLKLTRLYLSTREAAILPGASGIRNVYWNAKGKLWRVEFRFRGKRVFPGGTGFRSIVTARLTAESFRATLAAVHAKQGVRAKIACRKQYSLPLISSLEVSA